MGKTNLWLRFDHQIKKYYGDFTRAERKLADYMLENPERVISATATDLADEVGVSPASVIRFCKHCGFDGLAELKVSVKQEYQATHDPTMAHHVRKEDTISQAKQVIMNYHIEAVQNMLSGYNEAAYTYAADEILAAHQILVTSFGGSKAAALCLVDFLLQLDLPCLFFEDPSFCTMYIDRMTESDLVIAVTFSGRFKETVQNMQLAKSHHVRTIAITGSQSSPITEYADIVLNAGSVDEEYQWSTVSGRIAEMAVTEILYILLAAQKGIQAEDFRQINRALERQRLPRV